MFSAKDIISKEIWEDFLERVRPHTFLHSWEWGEFQEEREGKIWRFGVFEGDTLTAVFFATRIRARRGSFLFCPHGPIVHPDAFEHIEKIIRVFRDTMLATAKKEGASFFRVSPIFLNLPEIRAIFKELGFREAPIHMHPERAWLLDITPDEQAILAGMRKQTRHCIRNAERAGVTVRISNAIEDIDHFYTLYEATVARQDFTPFSRSYLKEEFLLFSKNNSALVVLGEYKGEYISGAIVVFKHDSGFYHHGASVLYYPKIPAAHSIQWEIIKEAKRRGLKWYNFWGVAPEGIHNHPWAGLSLFKKGFGGTSEEYVHAQDFVLSLYYWITYGFETMRRIKRRL